MNSISQVTRKTATVLAMVILGWASACKGPQGDVGPAGVAGPQGAQGPQGAVGSANVTQYKFAAEKTFTASYTIPVGSTDLDKSLVMVYFQISTEATIFPSPVEFPNTTYGRVFHSLTASSNSTEIRLIRSAATTTYNAKNVRVVVIPASTLNTGRQAAIDFSDYEAVKKAYNLPD